MFGERWLEASQENVSKHVRRRLLAAPARGLSIADLESFVRLYTQWCYKTQACVDALPRFGSLPGFFRLPTEIEWEYTARQHGGSDNRISSLPFEAAKATDFAYLSSATRVRERPTSIGRLQPTHFGVHDLYGNVSELLDGRFLAELGQGKPGMRVSRGGSYAFNAQSQSLRPSTRSEVQDWRLDENGALVPLRMQGWAFDWHLAVIRFRISRHWIILRSPMSSIAQQIVLIVQQVFQLRRQY